MLYRKILILLMIFIFSTSFSSLASSSENYDDCIFKNINGIGSDLAAKEIIDLCKVKHMNTKSSICFEIDAQTINGIFSLQDMNEPYTGKNLCNYINGQVKSKGNIKNGKLIGRLTKWYENGQISSEEHYLDGKQDGKWTNWFENGQMSLERNYKNGKKDGKWTYWRKDDHKIWLDGQISSEEHYKDGKKDT
jgi:antitoxin component YwqK of YwqJK toxin-antitoxin module